MDLLIKTDKDQTWLGLAGPDGQIAAQTTLKTDRLLASSLVGSCRDLLDETGLSWRQLTGVGAWAGPGPFTSLRVAHGFANGLSYGLQIPAANSADTKDWAADCQKQLRSGRQQLITPVYGAPPVQPPKPKTD